MSSVSVKGVPSISRADERRTDHYWLTAKSCRSSHQPLAGSKVCNNSCGVTWIWCVALLCSIFQTCWTQEFTGALASTASTDSPSTVQTTYSPTPQAFNFEDCLNSFDSSDQAKYVCVSNRGLFPILKYAESVGRVACEEEFKYEPWNCSGFSLLKQPSITRGDDVFKESAYVYGLSLAVIAHTVAMGCADDIIDCSCPDLAGGCSDNVAAGVHIAKTFLSKRYTSLGGGIKQQLVHHNFRVAETIILSVMNSTTKNCNCHGISGSCTFRVCQSELPIFSTVAKRMRLAYDESCRAVLTGHSRNSWVSRCSSNNPNTDTNLLYTKENSWCQYHPEIGSVGVVGRECSPHPNAPNSCSKLCGRCNRGSRQSTIEEVTQCNCQFFFCCDIKCETCVTQRTYHSCS